MQLTSEQLQSLDSGQPVSLLIDGRACVLLNSSVYEPVSRMDGGLAPGYDATSHGGDDGRRLERPGDERVR